MVRQIRKLHQLCNWLFNLNGSFKITDFESFFNDFLKR